MSTTPAFVSRLVRLPLTDADGDPVGRIRDVVLVPSGDQFRVPQPSFRRQCPRCRAIGGFGSAFCAS